MRECTCVNRVYGALMEKDLYAAKKVYLLDSIQTVYVLSYRIINR